MKPREQKQLRQYSIEERSVWQRGHRILILTILAWVQAECGPLQYGGILANIPDVEINKDGEGGESSHSEPSQHEDVCQHDELQQQQRNTDHI